MQELLQIGVTANNEKCLEMMIQSGLFDEQQEASRFAASLAIKKKLYSGINLNNYGSNFSTKWWTSLVDPDHFFRDTIKTLDICEDLGIGLRSLINIGLDYISKTIDTKKEFNILDLIND